MERAYVGRSLGAIALVPTAERDTPYVVLGACESKAAYPLDALELCVQHEANGGGGDGDDDGEVSPADLPVAAYSRHTGPVTALSADPRGTFVVSGSAAGALGVYPLGQRMHAGAPRLGVDDEACPGAMGPAFEGRWSQAVRGW